MSGAQPNRGKQDGGDGCRARTVILICSAGFVGCVLSCCGWDSYQDQKFIEFEMVVDGSEVRVESEPDKQEGFWIRNYSVVVYRNGSRRASEYIWNHPPSSIKGYLAENETIGLIIVNYDKWNSAHWYLFDARKKELRELGRDPESRAYYARLKVENPDLPDADWVEVRP